MEFQILIKDKILHGEQILAGLFVDLQLLLILFGGLIQKIQIQMDLLETG